jgi:mono/diheme cytochrome c family protein
MMPYEQYRDMSDEDVRSVVVYLRSLAPVKSRTAPIEVDFPVSVFVRLAPRPVDGEVHAPDPKDTVAYGGYLVKMAGCRECHTPMDGPALKLDEEFAGGHEFAIPHADGKRYRSVTANITPDPTGYFGRTTKEQWIAHVRSFARVAEAPPPIEPWQASMMPWLQFSGMTEEDLGAIYDFMKTVRPVAKAVKAFPDAPDGSSGAAVAAQ